MDAMHVSKDYVARKRVISGFCASDTFISKTNQTLVAVPDNINVYFAHRMLLATDKYFSNPH